MHAVLAWLRDQPSLAIYVVAGSIVFAETAVIIGLVLPSEITLLCVGYLAYAGTLSLPTAIAVMIFAAVAGDAIAYAEGRHVGPHLRDGRLGRRVGRRRWARAQRMLARYGGRAVAVGRFVAFARTLVPRLAGMSGVRYRRVLPWDLLGVVGSVAGSVMLGYLAGRSYARVADVFGQAGGALMVLALLVVTLVLVGRYLGRHRSPIVTLATQIARTWPLRPLQHWYTARFRRLAQRLGPDGAMIVNVAATVPVLLGIGYALTWLVGRVVRQSGLPQIDTHVAAWFAGQRTPILTRAAVYILTVLHGSYLVAVVAVVGLAVTPGLRAGRPDPLDILGTAGAVMPLLILAVVADLARPAASGRGALPNQVTLDAASLGMLAWLLTRRLSWRVTAAVWTVAFGVAVLVGGARLYLGRNRPSEVVASTLLGGLWILVFVVAWHTRAHTRATLPRRSEAPQVPTDRSRSG